MLSGVDEVRMGDQGSSDADNGTVQCRHEDLAMRVERLSYVQVVRGEGLEPLTVVLLFRTFVLAGGRDISASS